MNITLTFTNAISDAYKDKLRTFMEDVLAQGFTANRPPSIDFPGRNQTTFDKLERLDRQFID